jgi:hypothetical protein
MTLLVVVLLLGLSALLQSLLGVTCRPSPMWIVDPALGSFECEDSK